MKETKTPNNNSERTKRMDERNKGIHTYITNELTNERTDERNTERQESITNERTNERKS